MQTQIILSKHNSHLRKKIKMDGCQMIHLKGTCTHTAQAGPSSLSRATKNLRMKCTGRKYTHSPRTGSIQTGQSNLPAKRSVARKSVLRPPLSACQLLLVWDRKEEGIGENQRKVIYLHCTNQNLLSPNQKKSKQYLNFPNT